MAEEEPKYVLSFRSPNIRSEKEVSTAQVQFWPEYAEEFVESLKENGPAPARITRIDVFTNEYHSEHVRRVR